MNALFDSAICPQLVLTLGHFVWQGLAVGGLAWLAGLALRCGSSSARYRLYLAALLVMAACPVATFLWLNHEPTVEAAAERLPLVDIESAESFPRPASAAAEEFAVAVDGATPIAAAASEDRFDLSLAPAPWEASRTDWRRFAPWLTAVYLAGVLAMLVRLVLGLRGGRGLRRRSEAVADPALLELLTGRAVALGLRSVPVLAWCGEIAVPAVVGVLRPTILLPMSLTTGMTPDQLAAILTHELAHIRRWDPLVNVFQRIVEAVLFFHPMVWFVSRRIRQERENCCDDLVLATGTDPVGYASSLLDVAERAAAERGQTLTALAALRADGRTSELGGRIRRLLGAERHEAIRLNRPGLALTIAVALLALATLCRLAVNAEEEGPPEGKPAKVTLPNGVVVELVGVGFHPSKDREWWKPDGAKLETRPYDESGATVMPDSPKQADCREFRVEIRGLPREHAVTVDYGQVAAATGSEYREGLWVGDHAAGPFTSETTSIRIGLTTEPFGPTQSIDARGRKQEPVAMAAEFKPLYEQVVALRVVESEGRTELVFDSAQIKTLREQAQWQIHAIDLDGREQRSTFGSVTPDNELHLGFPIPPARVARFEYRLRPYRHWVTFRNVALQPGQRTHVKVEIETVEAAMSDDEQQAWRELEAMDVSIYGEPFHRQHLRRHLALLERNNHPEAVRKQFREEIEMPIRSADLWKVPPQALQWRLFMALQRQPLNEGQQARLADQNAWGRDDAGSRKEAEPTSGSAGELQSRVERPAEWGTLTGRFVFDGPAPEPERIRLRTEPAPDGSGRVHWPADRFYHDKDLYDESLAVGEDGGLANVFVYLRSPQAVPVHPDLEKPPAEQVMLRVRNGRFDPHVLAMRTDQKLVVRNEDPVGLNVRTDPAVSQNFNWLLRPEAQQRFAMEEEPFPFPIASDFNRWMTGWLLPRKTPYFAVSGEDGRFRIENLPAGEWEFVLWHERVGYLTTARFPRGRVAASITAGENDLGTIRVNPELFEKQDGNQGLEPTLLNVLEADGSPARPFNGVVRAHVGYQEPLHGQEG